MYSLAIEEIKPPPAASAFGAFGGMNASSFGNVDLKSKAAGLLQRWIAADTTVDKDLYEIILGPNFVNTTGACTPSCEKVRGVLHLTEVYVYIPANCICIYMHTYDTLFCGLHFYALCLYPYKYTYIQLYAYIKNGQDFYQTSEDQQVYRSYIDIILKSRLNFPDRQRECNTFLNEIAYKQRELPKIKRERLTWEQIFKNKVIEVRSELILG